MTLTELTYTMARAVAVHEQAVTVEEAATPGLVCLALTVDPADMGRVLGKGGRVAQAMRTLLYAAAGNAEPGRRVYLEISARNGDGR